MAETFAIRLTGVTKSFKKRTVRREYTTFKSELVRLLTFQRRALEPSMLIPALKGVDLTIPKGRTVGIIGRNGSGKSTLLKLMTGIYAPTTGKLEVEGRISALLDLGAGFHPDFTGRENIMINGIILGMTRAAVKERTEDIIKFAELGDFIDEPVRTYSSGMFMRLAFAVATHVDPEILIIDEILAVGDEHFQRKSMAKMTEFKQAGKTIVLVTHDLGTVTRWCDLCAWIDGGVTRMLGEPSKVVEAYKVAVNAAEAEAAQTGSSALSAPGLALPASAPALSVVRELEVAAAKLERVRLLDVNQQQVSQLPSDARLDVCLDFSSATGNGLHFTVEISNEAGPVFSTTLEAGRPAGQSGTAKLAIARLGLGEGQYQVSASVHAPDRQPLETVRSALTVTAHGAGKGLLRPPHVWSLDCKAGREAEAQTPGGRHVESS